MHNLGSTQLRDRSDFGLEELALIAGPIASYLDKSEHLERTEITSISRAGSSLRSLAASIARAHELDVVELYARRLDEIQQRNVLHQPHEDEGIPAKVQEAHSLRDLQLLQLAHDRVFHPDVFGLPRDDQLRHFLLHLVKIMSAAAASARDQTLRESFLRTRLPDMFLFGLKIATVVGERLADSSPIADSWR